jgi:hypothetical protein
MWIALLLNTEALVALVAVQGIWLDQLQALVLLVKVKMAALEIQTATSVVVVVDLVLPV